MAYCHNLHMYSITKSEDNFLSQIFNVTGEQSIAKQSFADRQIDIATSGSFLEFAAAIFVSAGKLIKNLSFEVMSRSSLSVICKR